MIELYFIRHGQASFGLPNYDLLSSVGERQAMLLGRHLRENGTHFDAVYSGALRRHVQTATIAIEQMNGDRPPSFSIDPDLNEFDDSDRMMNQLCAVIREDPGLSKEMHRIHTDHDAVARIFDIAETAGLLPDDEQVRLSQAQRFRARISGAIDNLVLQSGAHQKVAVFTSGGPTAVALRQAMQTSRKQTIRLGRELRNSAITVFRHNQDRLQLVLYNCVAHLEVKNDPELLTYI